MGQGTTTQGDRLDERALGNDAAVTEGESAEHGTDAPATTPGENHGGGGERGGTAGGGAVGNEPGNGEPGSGGATDGANVAGATPPLPAPTGAGSPQPGEGSTQPQPVDGTKQPQPGYSAQAGTPQREDPVPEQSAPDASSNEVASTKRETQGAPAA